MGLAGETWFLGAGARACGSFLESRGRGPDDEGVVFSSGALGLKIRSAAHVREMDARSVKENSSFGERGRFELLRAFGCCVMSSAGSAYVLLPHSSFSRKERQL